MKVDAIDGMKATAIELSSRMIYVEGVGWISGVISIACEMSSRQHNETSTNDLVITKLT